DGCLQLRPVLVGVRDDDADLRTGLLLELRDGLVVGLPLVLAAPEHVGDLDARAASAAGAAFAVASPTVVVAPTGATTGRQARRHGRGPHTGEEAAAVDSSKHHGPFCWSSRAVASTPADTGGASTLLRVPAGSDRGSWGHV